MAESTERASVLVVDDVPANIQVLSSVLKDEYRIFFAVNGESAIDLAMRERPDLVLLDVMMPEMDGYEVNRRLKEEPATREIPVIFVTAMGEVEDEVKGLALGAVDYVTKPVTPDIVRARVATHVALRKARQELEAKNDALHQERELVEQIVNRMRGDTHFEREGLRFLEAPLEQTSGDILLSARRPDGGRHVLLGDFTGHGLPAAIGGPLVSQIFYACTKNGCSMEEILREATQTLSRRLPTHLYMAACAFEVNAAGSVARVWNAGVPEALLVRGGAIVGRFPSSTLPLGITDSVDPAEAVAEHPLEPGDRLYAYSDGVTEATAPDGEMFGVERLESYLTQLDSEPDDLQSLLQRLDDYTEGGEQADDITLVEIGV